MDVGDQSLYTVKSNKIYLKIEKNAYANPESVVKLLKYRIFNIFGVIGFLKTPFRLIHHTTNHIYLQTLESCFDKLLVALDNHLFTIPLLPAEYHYNLSFIASCRSFPPLVYK